MKATIILKISFLWYTVFKKEFLERGMSIYGEITADTLSAIDEILNHESSSSMMIACQKKHSNPYAADRICRLAERLISQK